MPPELEPPRELSKVSLPEYRIEPPDRVLLQVMKLVPRSSYRIDAHDVLQIRATNVLLQQPIDDYFLVEGDGIVTLGPAYGVARVAGMTTDQAAREIEKVLRIFLQNPQVTVRLARSASAEDISRDYVVAPDGVIVISRFGEVHLAGKTVLEARLAIQEHLAQYFDSPTVSVSVLGYNSKNYYVIAAGVMTGETVLRFPIKGNETVLDAMGQLQNLSAVSTKTMWIARPAPGSTEVEQVLPIDWDAITQGGQTKTNYQLLPGDRLYIVDNSLVALNDSIYTLTRPVEQLLSFTSLGISTARNAQTMGRPYNLNRN